MSGATLQEAAALAQSRHDSQFYGDVDYATRYPQMETVAVVPWGEYTAYEVHLVTSEGQELTQYFDKETGLSVGGERMLETDMGAIPVRSICGQHQVFGGVTQPTHCTESAGPMETIITIETLQFDAPDFAYPPLPEAVRALIEEQNAASAEPVGDEEEPAAATEQP